LALLLAGKHQGRAETGWSDAQGADGTTKAEAKLGEDNEKPRSRSPKTSRVTDAAAALEAKMAA
jgi:hypothetical protein